MEKGCPKCGRMVDENNQICPYCNFNFKEIENFFKRVKETKYLEDEKYAGFIKRTIAGLIDIELILLLTEIIIFTINNIITINYKNYIIHISIFIFLYVIINSILERTKWRGSLGKRIVRIEALDEYENPLTFSASIKRNIVKIVNILSLGIGLLMSITDKNKRTLSDRLSKTCVLSKLEFEEIDTKVFASPFKRFWAFIIDICIISGLVYFLTSIPLMLNKANIEISNNIEVLIKNALWIISVVIIFFYFPFAESSTGKTTGKKLMRVKLTDDEMNILTFPKAFIRQFLIIIDLMVLGFLLPFTNKKRKTIKDIITKTVVIDS